MFDPEVILSFIKPYLEALAGNYGAVGQVLSVAIMVVGFARVFIKPVRDLIFLIVSHTVTKKDDEIFAKVEASKWVKAIAYLADYIFSLKLPPKPAVVLEMPAPAEPGPAPEAPAPVEAPAAPEAPAEGQPQG